MKLGNEWLFPVNENYLSIAVDNFGRNILELLEIVAKH